MQNYSEIPNQVGNDVQGGGIWDILNNETMNQLNNEYGPCQSALALFQNSLNRSPGSWQFG